MEKLQLEFPPDNAPLVIVGGFLTRNSTAYWGDIDQYFTERDGNARRIIIAPVGACSSVHDRACEIYYSLMGGGRVDYGAEHAMAHKHGRYGRKYPVGLYPQWSVDHPVHFVSHSLGGPTVLKLISLLRTGFFNRNRSSREHHRHHRHNIFHHHHHHHHEQDEVDSTSSDSLLTSPTCHPAMVRSLLAFAGPFQGTPSVYLLGAPYNANETTLRSFSIGNFLAKYIHISSFLTPLVGGATTKKAGEGEGEEGAKQEGNGNGLISGLGEYDGWDWQGDSRNLGMFDGGLFETDPNHRHGNATSGADGMSMHSKRSANTALSKRPQRSWRAFKRSVGTLWTQLRKSDWADSSDSGSYDAGLYAADFRERAGENMVCPQVFYASFTGSVTYKHSDSDHHRPDRSFRGDLFVYIMAKMMGSFSYKLDPVPEFLYRKEDPAELERERERLRVEEEEKQAKRLMEKRKSKERRRLSALLIMPTVVLNHSRTSLDEFTSFTSSGSTAIVSGPAPATASAGTMVMMTNNNSSQDGQESLDGHGSESSLSLPATTTTTTPSMEIVPATSKSTTLSNPPPPPPPASTPAPAPITSSSSSSSSVLVLSPAELLKIKLKKKARRESMMNRRSTMTSPPSVEPIAEESSPVSYTMPGSWPIPTPIPTPASASTEEQDEGLSFRGGRRRSVSASTSFEEVDEMRRADGGEEVVRLSFSNESMRSEYEGGSEGGHGGGGSDLGHEFVADHQQQQQLRQQQQQEAEPRLSTSTNSCGSSAWHSSTLSHSTSWSSSSAHSSSWSSSWSSSLASSTSTSTSAYSPSSSYFPPVQQTTTTTGYPFDPSSSLSSLIPIATATTAVPIPTPMVQSSETISSSSLHSLHIVPTSPSSDVSSSWSSPTTPQATTMMTMNASSSSAFLQVPEPPSLQVTPPTPLSPQESLAEKFGSLVSVASASDSMMETTEHGQLATIAHHDTSSLRSLTPTPTAPTFVINLGVEDEDGSEMGGLERTEGGLGVRASLKPKRESSRHSRRWSSTDKFAQWAQQWTDKADPLRSFAAFTATTTTTAGNEGDANESEEHASMANKAKSRKSALDKLIGAGAGTGDDSSVRTKPMSIHGGSEASSEEPTTTTTNPIPAKRLRNDLWENDGIVPVFSQMHPSDCADGHCRHHGTLLLRNGGMKPHRANKSTSSLGAAGTGMGTGSGANGTGASTTSLVPSPTATSCPGTPMQDTFAAPRPSTSSIQSATADGGSASGSASASRLRRSFTFDRRSFDLTSFFSSNGSGSGSADRGTHVGSGGGSLGGNENAGGTMALGSADALRIGMLERGVWHVFHTPGMAHNCLVGGLARYEQQRTELWKKIAETVKDLDMAAAAAKLSAATTTSPSTLSSPTSSPTV